MDKPEIASFLLFAVFLIWKGVSPRARFAAWRMFSRSPRAFFKLQCDGKAVDIWKALPHSSLAVYFEEIFAILSFLKNEHPRLEGTIVLVQYPLVLRIQVRNAAIVSVRRRHVAG